MLEVLLCQYYNPGNLHARLVQLRTPSVDKSRFTQSIHRGILIASIYLCYNHLCLSTVLQSSNIYIKFIPVLIFLWKIH